MTHHLCFHGYLSSIFKSSGRGRKSGAGAGGTELSCTHGGASESLESFLNNLNLFYAGKSPTLASKHGLNVGHPHRETNGALARAVVAWRKRGVVASVSQGTASTGAGILDRSAGSVGGRGFHISRQKPCQCDPQVGSSETIGVLSAEEKTRREVWMEE